MGVCINNWVYEIDPHINPLNAAPVTGPFDGWYYLLFHLKVITLAGTEA